MADAFYYRKGLLEDIMDRDTDITDIMMLKLTSAAESRFLWNLTTRLLGRFDKK